MKLISTTLTGNAPHLIEDAIRSVVSWVDLCLVIDTGVTDDTLQRARRIAADKYASVTFPWPNDFAAARNFALDAAAARGGTWAVTVDTDERIALRGAPIRDILAEANEECFQVAADVEDYAKERFFRLPAKGRWVGRTHETFAAAAPRPRLARAAFEELPKTAGAMRAKRERDLPLLEAQIEATPHEPRWFYYLGESLRGLERWREAVAAYARCEALPGWDEQRAWSCYRAAECHVSLREFDAAVAACARGLAHHAGIAELAWYAAFASFQAGRMEQAKWWAWMSESMGHFTGRGTQIPRTGFRSPRALYEGPFDILVHAHQRLGEDAEAAKALYLFEAARRAREARAKG